MAATRGARYLLRNGLDYINYQEYERALKYLREAEARQKQLNDTEKLTLKQAIERAQRGLREAVGSQAPYSLSSRSRRPGGFAPAKPDNQIASKPAAPAAPVNQALPRLVPSREGDDLGQPIRLAGAEIPTQSVTPPVSPAQSTRNKATNRWHASTTTGRKRSASPASGHAQYCLKPPVRAQAVPALADALPLETAIASELSQTTSRSANNC